MKLTEEQIQFIDRALADADFKYSDIRYEITDHIATAIERQEGDFYVNFDSYIQAHRSEIFKTKRQFIKLARRKAITALGNNLCKPWAIALIVIINAAGIYAHKFYERADVADALDQIFHAIFFIMLLPLAYRYLIYKQVYAAAVTAGSTLGMIFCIGLPGLRIHRLLRNSDLLFTYYGVIITLAVALLVTTYKLDRTYKLRYNGN